MKRIINILQSIVLSAFALIACQREEIVETPQFKAVDEAGNVVSSLDQSGQYTLELMSNAYSLAENKSTETLKASPITISSNCTWKIVPAEEGQDWVYPYPDHGENEGRFIFISERNFDQKSDRTAYFNVIVNDGIVDRMLDGMIVVNQASSADFLKVSKASLDILKEGAKNQKISVLSNLEWSYSLTPDPDYATEDLSWIEDKTVHPADQSIDTLVFTFADNTNGSIRGAILDIKAKGKPEFDKSIKVVQYGADVEIEGFPVMWEVDCNPNTYATIFPSTGVIPPVSGAGQIRFDNTCGKAADTNNKTKLDISSDCPRVTGPWPGDYCEFKAFSPVSAGSLIKLTFTTRVSATGHKYWRLEYRDGSEWKIAGTPMTDPAVSGPDGNPVVYTHVMAADGKTNIAVSSVVKYANTTDEVDFRFYCAANFQASGAGPLEAPNGGTWRLAMDGADTGTPLNPSISCVSAGSEALTPANVVVTGVSDDILTFEGTPEEPATIGVTSDMDFTVTANVPWLTVENGTGLADETKEVSIICAPSEQSTLRRGEIEIKSGITKRIIKVIQSAAGSILEPFVSICEGNYLEVGYEEKIFNYGVQANVEYTVTTDADWITILPATRALVEVTPLNFTVSKNEGSQERVGKIVITNEEYGLETVLTVTQGIFEPLYCEWLFGAETMDSYVSTFGGLEKDPSSKVKDAGDCGMYVASNIAGNGKIKYIQVDKTVIDVSDKTTHYVGGSGHPLVTGVWPGDYWLFEATDGMEYPAGTKLNISFITRISATGQKYWMLECWDGESWKPASEYEVKTATVGSETVSYNFEPVTTTKNSTVNATWTLVQPCTVMQFRYKCVANYNAKNTVLDAPNGGTCRIAGADGTSPVFRVVRD